jgi:hypothetical protein
LPLRRNNRENDRHCTTVLDKDYTQISFPITNGELQILNGSGEVNDHKPVTALYSQTFCNVHGSLFMAGGTLVAYLR